MGVNTDRLKQLKEKHNLSWQDVASLLSVSMPTVVSWTRPEPSKAFRPMPDNLLELLEYKLGERR